MPVVVCERVSKRFWLAHDRPRSFQELVIGFWRRSRGGEDLWALREVTFSVEAGEVFGVIGANGSGKSTLLKIIAGILAPTAGQVLVRGRLAALLELGAGFHPDLTGRENIFLNGALLGFSRAEIARRFEEIVAFAELERFVDTPLKHYSSGMQVRLGFAIAVSSDPEVLLADEVLAVGDERFQRKCLERIAHLVRQGGAVILVSHNLDLVRSLCGRALWLERGEVRALGAAAEVVDQYQTAVGAPSLAGRGLASGIGQRWGSREVEIARVDLVDRSGQPRTVFWTGEPFAVRIWYQAHRSVARPVFGSAIHAGEGMVLTGPNTRLANRPIPVVEGPGLVEYRVEALNLLRGLYYLTVAVYDEYLIHAYDHHDRLYAFRVEQPPAISDRFGCLYLPADWSHHPGRRPAEVPVPLRAET